MFCHGSEVVVISVNIKKEMHGFTNQINPVFWALKDWHFKNIQLGYCLSERTDVFDG